jgi:hypothetical protein
MNPRFAIAAFCLLLASHSPLIAEQTRLAELLAQSQPNLQEKINATFQTLMTGSRRDIKSMLRVDENFHRLRNSTDDDKEMATQMAIFVATTASEENAHVIIGWLILNRLELSPSVLIRVLAPHLDSENDHLRAFARGWFQSHDGHKNEHFRSQLASLDFHDYAKYANARIRRNEEIPDAFIMYLFERDPAKAFLVFAYANRGDALEITFLEMRKNLGIRQQGRERTPEELRQTRENLRQAETIRQQEKLQQREMLLAEHLVSDAIWFKENKFDDEFKAALTDAAVEVGKLARHEQWWARLYVAHLMREHSELRQPDVVKQLAHDPDRFVRAVAKSIAK